MQIERKALYNLLRMNWLQQPDLDVEPWQVDDYRGKSDEELLQQLAMLKLPLSLDSFAAYAENCDTPEDLVDLLLDEEESDDLLHDRVYLIIFELWRRH